MPWKIWSRRVLGIWCRGLRAWKAKRRCGGCAENKSTLCSVFPPQGVQHLKRKLIPQFLFLVAERFAVGSYLNLGFLPVFFDLGLIGHELSLLGEGLDLQDFSVSGLGLQSPFDFRRERIQ